MSRHLHFIGHSHIEALVLGAAELELQSAWTTVLPDDDGQMTIYRDGAHRLNSVTLESINSIETSAARIASIGGNAHNWFGLFAWSPVFDFYYPGFCEKVAEGVEIIPFESVRIRVSQILERSDAMMLRAVFNDVRDVRANIQSPPPMKNDALTLERMDPVFLSKHPDARLADPWLRLKLWKLHSDIYQEICQSYSIPYIQTPVEALDADGFLKDEFCDHRSSTHASTSYGKLVANQLMETVL